MDFFIIDFIETDFNFKTATLQKRNKGHSMMNIIIHMCAFYIPYTSLFLVSMVTQFCELHKYHVMKYFCSG